jgi:aerotaxis receptor
MRINQPVTNHEYVLPEDEVIITRTDLKGQIEFANGAFLRAGGLAREDVIGKPQNIVRHPDVPAAVFEDLWHTIRSGRPWSGVVKNRRNDGGFCWVLVNVTPSIRNGEITGYISVCTRPTKEEIASTERLYADLKRERDARWRLSSGRAIRKGIGGIPQRVLGVSATGRLSVLMAAQMSMILLVPICMANRLLDHTAGRRLGWAVAVAAALSCWGMASYLARNVFSPLARMSASALLVLSGDLQHRFQERGETDIQLLGRLLNQMNGKHIGVLMDTLTSFDRLREASEGVANGNADLSARTEQQASVIEKTTATSAQIADTAKRNTESEKQAGVEDERTTEAASGAAEAVPTSLRLTDELADLSRRISEITATVDGIACQTNLLALSAAVEAASAGQDGRRFAVMSGEARVQARQSEGVAREIASLVGHSLELMTASARAAASAGGDMATVEQSIAELTRAILDIAEASGGQSVDIGESRVEVERLAKITQLNAARVEESAAASVEPGHQAEAFEDAATVLMA